MLIRTSALRLLSATLIATLLILPQADGASAAGEEIVWGVQPANADGPDGRNWFNYSVAPGTVINDWVAVTNRGTTSATLRVYSADATADYDSGAFTLVGADVASTDAGAWTSVDGTNSTCPDTDDAAEAACATSVGTSVTLEPGQRVIVPFTITVPDNATPGDHSAGVVAGLVSEASGNGATVRREDRVGARIYLRVDGDLLPGLNLTGTTANYDASLLPFAPGDGHVAFDVVNTGNTRISTNPTVHLTGPFGIDLGTVTLDPVENLVPGASTRVTTDLPGVPPLLLLSAEITLAALPVSGMAADDPLPSSASTSVQVWAVPWTGLAVIALAAGLVWFVLWRRRRVHAARDEEEWIKEGDRMSAEYVAEDQSSSGTAEDGHRSRTDELA